LWFVVLAAGWLIVRRRPARAERYRQFQAEMNRPIGEAAETTAPAA
jgi:D-serine/D-alanine/glycine transporter